MSDNNVPNIQNVDIEFNHSLKDALEMQQDRDFLANKPNRRSLLLEAFKNVPFVTDFLQRVDESGHLVGALLEVKGDQAAPLAHAAQGLEYGRLGLAIIDFVKIPIMYIVATILNVDLPFKLSNLAKWTYASVLLGLAIAAIIVPGAATALALAGSSLALATSVYSLGRYFYQKRMLEKESTVLAQEIEIKQQKFIEIQQQAKKLTEELLEASGENNKEKLEQCHEQIRTLKRNYNLCVQKLEGLYISQFLNKEKREKMTGLKLMDKGVGISLSLLTVVGLSLALVFPPVGLPVAITAASLGVVYILGRLATSYWESKKSSKKVEEAVTQKDENQDESVGENHEKLLDQHVDASPKQSIKETLLAEHEDVIYLPNLVDEEKHVQAKQVTANEASIPVHESTAEVMELMMRDEQARKKLEEHIKEPILATDEDDEEKVMTKPAPAKAETKQNSVTFVKQQIKEIKEEDEEGEGEGEHIIPPH